jgi:hypothetical protein
MAARCARRAWKQQSQVDGKLPAAVAQDVFETPQFLQPEAQSRDEALHTPEDGLVTGEGHLLGKNDSS